MGISGPILWVLPGPDDLASPTQSGLAPGASKLANRRSARLGQAAVSHAPDVPVCVADLHIVRRNARALVARTDLGADRRPDRADLLIRAAVPDISGKCVSFHGRPYSVRARAHRGGQWPISLCAPPNVCRHGTLCSRDTTAAGGLVRCIGRGTVCGHASAAGDVGGTHIVVGITWLCSLYGASEISTHSLYLVMSRKEPYLLFVFE